MLGDVLYLYVIEQKENLEVFACPFTKIIIPAPGPYDAISKSMPLFQYGPDSHGQLALIAYPATEEDLAELTW